MKISKNLIHEYIDKNEFLDFSELKFLHQLIAVNNDEFIDINFNTMSDSMRNYILTNENRINFEDTENIQYEYFDKKTSKNNSHHFWNIQVRGLNTIIDIYETYLKKEKYNFDFRLGNNMFPIFVDVCLVNTTKYYPRHILIIIKLKFGKTIYKIDYEIYSDTILVLKKLNSNLTFELLLKCFNLYPQHTDLKNFYKLIDRSKELELHNGKQYKTNSNLLFIGENNLGNLFLEHIYTNISAKLIIENNLEYKVKNRNLEEKNTNILPYIRVFSLSHKKYLYAFVDDIKPYEYNEKNIEFLYLPQNIKSLLNKLFSTNLNDSYQDLSENKGGNYIILAEGESGIGKTSTAEVYSENAKIPLYVLQVDELGTNAKEFEQKLSVILTRIQQWKAILLFDEVDIFLSHRNENLEKSAIVGIFLRILEYYKGILFFTTNKINVIDSAILSRVTIRITYPKLDEEARKNIWLNNLQNAGLIIDKIDSLAKIELNGREIRNYIKLGMKLFENHVKETEFLDIIKQFPR